MKFGGRMRLSIFLRHTLMLLVIDLLIWPFAIVAAQFLRFDFRADSISVLGTILLVLIVVVLQITIGWFLWIYRRRYITGSLDEVVALFVTVALVSLGGSLAIIWVPSIAGMVPRSTLILAAPIAFTAMGAFRYIIRAFSERRMRPSRDAQRAIIFGAGYVGRLMIQRLLTDPAAELTPVALLDDDPAKQNVSVRGVRVFGGLASLAEVASEHDASTVIVCVGFADTTLLQRIDDAAKQAGVRVLVLPPLDKLFEGTAAVEELRELSIEDLIGRHPVRLDTEAIASYISGSKVLVTGAGGSIGAELSRQISTLAPAELILLDRDETGLQQTQISIRGHGLLHTDDVVLADIRDADTIRDIFVSRAPDVVFHAAALKHLPLLEQYPEEGWKTNVVGTANVLQAAAQARVKTFVNISTDKAANPTSVLGHSKRVAEKITAGVAESTENRYLSVRFGNVIGSRGSMLPTFAQLIAEGGPVTITHPDVTRYFMTIPEACQLVIQAGAIGRGGEVLILDMGVPVRILDVARRMIEQSGKKIEIVYTGLRQGEKLHEELIGSDESDERPFHPKISHARVKQLRLEDLHHDEWFARLRR